MLVLKRREGQWVEITHKSGDTIRIRVYNIRSRYPGQLDLAFEDEARNFEIQRPERALPASPEVAEADWREGWLDPRPPHDDRRVERRDAPDPRVLRPLAHFLARKSAPAPGRIRQLS